MRKEANIKLNCLLHGADYNPEQWLDTPEVLEEDIRLMQQAGINCVSVGIFSWTALEPAEGVYTFQWLDQVIEHLYENGIYTVLATPSGAKPGWMAKKYPEILRVEADRRRNLQGGRHNHCYTSPVYREMVTRMNTRLARRYAHHPGVILWHVSNEIQGECHCPLCQAAFRIWLKEKYGSLEKLNRAYWTAFWSHTYTDWEEIESPAPQGETNVHGLVLDWRRFCTAQTVDFFRVETAPLRAENPEIPVTMNMMGFYDGIDYWQFLPELDIISWDSYPSWHNGDGNEGGNAVWNGAYCDAMRAMKHKPWLLMENSPSTTNWIGASRHKRPGFHRLTAIQNLAHGSDSIQYFQWRQSRGSCEKFHSAVVSHNSSPEVRIFREVAGVGAMLKKLKEIRGSHVPAKAAIIYDVQNGWAIGESKGPRNIGEGYLDLILRIYEGFWRRGIPVDLVHMDAPLDGYRFVAAPMLYMLRGDIAQRLRRFAEQGGTLLTSYLTGLVDETDLCYLGQTPACGLTEVLGLWAEEIDGLWDHQHNGIVMQDAPGMQNRYEASRLCEVVHPTTAETLGVYESDYYQGMPAVTVNRFGKGRVYYVGTFGESQFYYDLLGRIAPEAGLSPALDTELPYGVTVGIRQSDTETYYFLQNFNKDSRELVLPFPLEDLETGGVYTGTITLAGYGGMVCTRAKEA